MVWMASKMVVLATKGLEMGFEASGMALLA
jgi:hypothetical protein